MTKLTKKDLTIIAIASSSSGGGGGGGSTNWGSIGGDISTQTDLQTALDLKENTITAGTTAQYYRGDKTWQTLDKNAVGLSNVDNTSDLNKPISTATQTALNLKADKSTTYTKTEVDNLSSQGKTQWVGDRATYLSIFNDNFTDMFDSNSTPVDITPYIAQFTKTSYNILLDTVVDNNLTYIKANSFRDRYTPLFINFRAEGSVSNTSERKFFIYFQRKDGLVIFGGEYTAGANSSVTSFDEISFNINFPSDIDAGSNDGWYIQGYRIFVGASNTSTNTKLTLNKILLRMQHLS